MNDFLLSGGEKFLFWLYKHLNKKLLKKYLPLNDNDFQVDLANQPQIYINEQINHCNISFSIFLKNYTNYEVFVPLVQIDLTVNDYSFLNCEKVILNNFKPKEGTQFHLDIPITIYQVRKIVQMLPGSGNVLNANFTLRIPSKNILGEKHFDKRLFKRIEVRYIPLDN